MIPSLLCRHLRRFFLCGGLLLALSSPAALASGGGDPEDLFFMSYRPDMPLAQFVAQPGGFYSSYRAPYQVIWYWHLKGERFDPESVKALTDMLTPLADYTYDGGSEQAIEQWQDIRGKTLVRIRPSASKKTREGSASEPTEALKASRWDSEGLNDVSNCYGDAFRNAADRLRQHVEQKRASADLLAWIQTQDWVFSRCGAGDASVPPSLSDRAPAWLQDDHAYQLAAGAFYAGDLDAAKEGFTELAEDSESHWRHLARYMELRVLARQHPGQGMDDKDVHDPKAQAALDATLKPLLASLLKDKALKPLWPSVYRLGEGLKIRYLGRPQRLAQLGKSLETIGNPYAAAARVLLLNRELRRWSAASWNTEELPSSGDRLPNLVRWLATLRELPTREENDHQGWQQQIGWQEYTRTKSLPWLFAAASFTPAGDKHWPTMIQALDAVPADSPARYAAQQLVANYLNSTGKGAEVRTRLIDFELSPVIQASPSERNVLSALLLPSAHSEDEWLRWALRPTAGWRDPEAVDSERGKAAGDKPYTMLDEDVVTALNTRVPLPMLIRFAGNPKLESGLQSSILEAAWTRALLTGRFDLVRQVSRQLASKYGTKEKAESAGLLNKAALLQSDQAADWQHLLLERLASTSDRLSGPYLRGTPWAVPTPVWSVLPADSAVRGAIDLGSEEAGAKWCRPFGLSGMLSDAQAGNIEPFAFAPTEEQQAHRQDLKRLREVPIDTVYFTQAALALMERERRDPLVPQALSTAIKMSRYTCNSKEVGKWSQKGLQVLQREYPNSVWAKTTRYWYDGR